MKREAYKVFGKPAETLTEEKDSQIYNDHDFYQLMLKDFLVANEAGAETGADSDPEIALTK